MSKIYTSVEQLIGGTPLLELTHIEKEDALSARLLVKLEAFNPGGSAKDRVGLAMIDEAEAAGTLRPLAVVRDRLRDADYAVENIDATVIAQRPKLAPHIPEMRRALCGVLELPEDRLNIKATTEEHLGFTGRGEGIACHCVCLLG